MKIFMYAFFSIACMSAVFANPNVTLDKDMKGYESSEFQCEPEAEAFILDILQRAENESSFLSRFGHELAQNTSTRLFDWLDHVSVSTQSVQAIENLGFKEIARTENTSLYVHPRAQLPLIRVDDTRPSLGFAVESIEDFLSAQELEGEIEGTYLSPLRRASIANVGDIEIQVVERRVLSAVEPMEMHSEWISTVQEAMQFWSTRPRVGDDDQLMAETEKRAQELSQKVGEEFAAWIVLKVERDYWQSKNRAGQWQKERQDAYGLGWANQDHHTFRSSRKYFSRLVRVFESLGFFCRERFYAGKEAGWGAQVMEHKNARYVLFLDTDLLEDELAIDFAHTELGEIPKLGTIGLWSALHGESILAAGMHHLEAQFSFELMKESLEQTELGMMKPFSVFPFLKQAFSKGEVWSVDPSRLAILVNNGRITQDQRDRFEREGAIGSHLENLERNQGYKGFNQKNVSSVIKDTDPRRQ